MQQYDRHRFFVQGTVQVRSTLQQYFVDAFFSIQQSSILQQCLLTLSLLLAVFWSTVVQKDDMHPSPAVNARVRSTFSEKNYNSSIRSNCYYKFNFNILIVINTEYNKPSYLAQHITCRFVIGRYPSTPGNDLCPDTSNGGGSCEGNKKKMFNGNEKISSEHRRKSSHFISLNQIPGVFLGYTCLPQVEAIERTCDLHIQTDLMIDFLFHLRERPISSQSQSRSHLGNRGPISNFYSIFEKWPISSQSQSQSQPQSRSLGIGGRYPQNLGMETR